MGLKDKFRERMERGKKRHREGQERRSDEAYLRDIDELRRLRQKEKRLDVRVKLQRTKARIGKKRGETSTVRKLGGRVLDYMGPESPRREPPKKKPAKKKKRKQRKPREPDREREVRRDAFGVPL